MAQVDRIAEIKHHLAEADGDEATVSVHRWAAARLIYEEVQSGTSRRALAEQVGKSHTHIRYMYNCWDIVGRKLQVSGSEKSLPNFQAIYASDEIRGMEDGEEQKGSGDRRRKRPDDENSYTTHGLVVQAATAIDALARNKTHHSLLTEDDLKLLRAIPPTVRALLRESGR